MSDPLQRYLKLGLSESLPRAHQYPLSCTELGFILRHAYSKLPKNLQSLLFQDTLSAFRLLPEMRTQSATSAVNHLRQCAEVALPKQKKAQVIAEFKHAMVAYKRRCKFQREEGDSAQLPQDVLVHIFSFLDMQSLASVATVCWSWNLAACEHSLWRLQYLSFFGHCNHDSVREGLPSVLLINNKVQLEVDWREAFKKAYKGNSSKKFTTYRGYCAHCKAIVWLNNMKCSNRHDGLKSQHQQIKSASLPQIVEYLLDDYYNPFFEWSSDSDSDSEEASMSRLWAYPRHIKGC